MFDKKEIQLLIALVEAHKGSIDFLRGLRVANETEQEEINYYNALIEKIKKL